MSFAFEGTFTNAAVAYKFVVKQACPGLVIEFITAALRGVKGAVHVKACGHLYNGDYQNSNCTIVVEGVNLISEVS